MNVFISSMYEIKKLKFKPIKVYRPMAHKSSIYIRILKKIILICFSVRSRLLLLLLSFRPPVTPSDESWRQITVSRFLFEETIFFYNLFVHSINISEYDCDIRLYLIRLCFVALTIYLHVVFLYFVERPLFRNDPQVLGCNR